MNHCTALSSGFLMLCKMLVEFQKNGPWTNHYVMHTAGQRVVEIALMCSNTTRHWRHLLPRLYIICKATFYNRPHWNWSIDSKDIGSWRVSKNKGNKKLICFVWLYLNIRICESWLILLDQITNVVFGSSLFSWIQQIHFRPNQMILS